jgi:hypothetical protein
MSVTLGLTAEKTMDLYYQQYKHEDEFFDKEDFIFYCAAGYAALVQEEYEKMYNRQAQETGMAAAIMNPEWFQPLPFPVTFNGTLDQYEAKLPQKPFGFRFDNSLSSIEGVYPLGGNCRQFVRHVASENWMLPRLPKTSKVFWYYQGGPQPKLIFKNVGCGLKQVQVNMIPSLASLDPNAPVPESMLEDIMRRCLALMFEAKAKNVVVDKTQDGNLNKIPESELNQEYLTKKT